MTEARIGLTIFLIWLIVLAIIVGLSLGVGWLVHAVVPGIDLGQSAVFGVVAVVAAWHGLFAITKMIREQRLEDLEEQGELDLDDVGPFYMVDVPRSERWERQRGPKREGPSKRRDRGTN